MGAIFAVTGRASFLGDPEKKTVEMIAEWINKAGGINGHPLELIIYDDEGDATKCNVAMKKLINQDKVPKDTDLTAQLTKIKGTGAQAIVNWSIGPTQILAVKNWRALGMDNIFLYQSHGFGSRKNIELCGKDAEGVFCPLARVNIGRLLPDNHIQKEVVMKYTESYEKKYNEPIAGFGGHAWDSLYIAVKALETVGPDRAKIRDFIENLTGFVGQLIRPSGLFGSMEVIKMKEF